MAEIRPVFNPNRVPLHEVIPLDTPFIFGINPTTACNIRCKYCYHSLGVKKLAELGYIYEAMSLQTLERVLENLKHFPNRIKVIDLYGGSEPLCCNELPQFIKLTKEADICDTISIITNGTLLTHEKTRALIDSGLNRIFFSLQGIKNEKYLENSSAKVEFSKIYDNIKYLYEYANKDGVKKCTVHVKTMDILLDEGDDEAFKKMFNDYSDVMHIETIRPLFSQVDYSEILDNNMTTSRFGRPHSKQAACYLAFYMMVVHPNGNITPCGCMEPVSFGNISNTTLVDAWNSETRKQFLIKHLRGERLTDEKLACHSCDFPNDVPYETDEIDPYADKILRRFL